MESNQSQPKSGYPLWRNFAKTASLFTTVGVLLALQTSCGGDEYETVAVVDTIKTTELTQGVITVVKEIAPNQYEIQEEKTVPSKADTRVIVKKLDGKVDTFTTEQVKAMVTAQDSLAARDTALHTASRDTSKKTKTQIYQNGYSPTMHTLGYVLMGGMMGYFIGKSLAMPPNPNVYRYPQQQYMNNQYSSGSGSSGGSSYRYSGSSASSSNQNAYSSLRSTATTSTRTVTSYKSVPSGRSGFFGGRSSGSSSGRSSYGG